jgi:hypothetical protein
LIEKKVCQVYFPNSSLHLDDGSLPPGDPLEKMNIDTAIIGFHSVRKSDGRFDADCQDSMPEHTWQAMEHASHRIVLIGDKSKLDSETTGKIIRVPQERGQKEIFLVMDIEAKPIDLNLPVGIEFIPLSPVQGFRK